MISGRRVNHLHDRPVAGGRAIQNRERRGRFLVSFVDYADSRDELSKAAQVLMMEAGNDGVFVCGIVGGEVHVSARSNEPAVALGGLLKEAFGGIGSAGGHNSAAGAQVPLAALDLPSGESPKLLASAVEEKVWSLLLGAARRIQPGRGKGAAP